MTVQNINRTEELQIQAGIVIKSEKDQSEYKITLDTLSEFFHPSLCATQRLQAMHKSPQSPGSKNAAVAFRDFIQLLDIDKLEIMPLLFVLNLFYENRICQILSQPPIPVS